MNATTKLLMTGVMLASTVFVGCAASTDPSDDGAATEAVDEAADEGGGLSTKDWVWNGRYWEYRPEEVVCHRVYSAVVPAYIAYASVHCDGWDGKVFCEYSSLSSTYGPGWGTCQCYNDICEKRGRACRSRYGC
jgi:hypothetical protein